MSFFIPAPLRDRVARGSAEGNRWLQQLSARVFSTNGLHQVSALDGVAILYGPSGNLVARGTRTFHYDAFRRLVSVQDGATTVATFQYDGLGRLHNLTTGTGNQRFAHWMDELVQVIGTGARQLTPSPQLDLREAAERLLANTVIENYRIEVMG